MEEQEKIIAYRIGESLFCLSCYEEGAKRLKEVQRSEDPQVTFPSKSIKTKDVSIFICEGCKTIKGPSAGEVKIQKPVEFGDLQDIINNSVSKIAFLEDFFATYSEDAITESGAMGLFLILHNLQDDLKFVNDQLYEKWHNGSIIEKKAN